MAELNIDPDEATFHHLLQVAARGGTARDAEAWWAAAGGAGVNVSA